MKYWLNGFYLNNIENSYPISDDEWLKLLEEQATGKEIKTDVNGKPYTN